MKEKFHIILFAILVFLFATCTRDNVLPYCNQVTIAPEGFLDYWFFKNGSSWIYELVDSGGIYDTVTITLAKAKYDLPIHPNTYQCKMYYKFRLNHSNKIFHINDMIIGYEFWSGFVSSDETKWFLNQSTTANNYHTAGLIVSYPYKKGEVLLNGSKLQNIVTCITPFGTFNSTLHVIPAYGGKPADSTITGFKNIFLAKGVGIVKADYSDGRSWELINYSIK